MNPLLVGVRALHVQRVGQQRRPENLPADLVRVHVQNKIGLFVGGELEQAAGLVGPQIAGRAIVHDVVAVAVGIAAGMLHAVQRQRGVAFARRDSAPACHPSTAPGWPAQNPRPRRADDRD